jgi:hypothetical protein
LTAKPAAKKTGSRQNLAIFPQKTHRDRDFPGPVRLCYLCGRTPASRIGTYFCAPLYRSEAEDLKMLVERGLQVMNVEAVGEAYAIASNYLRRTGAIADTIATNERLLAIIVQMFQRGEYNKIRLANKAITIFEAETLVA